MEVVCLILDPMLTSCVSTILTLFACFLGTSIPTFSFILIENVFIILLNVSSCFYYNNYAM